MKNFKEYVNETRYSDIDTKKIKEYIEEIGEGASVGDLLKYVQTAHGIPAEDQDYIEYVIKIFEKRLGDMRFENIVSKCVKETVSFIKRYGKY